MDILEHLEEEHRKVEKMIADLESTQTFDQREPILAELGDALSKHMDVEEERLYPIVDDRLGSDKAREAQKEHDTARDDVAQLVEYADADGFAVALAQFKADISHHVSEEENEMFPQLREHAADAIAALGDPEQVEDEVEQDLADEGITA
jgi:iron-sulfur cluster repair protein YtfE (RIC family)